MIVINSSAKSLDFCGNGLSFKIDSSSAFSNNGSTEVMVLIVNSAITNGNTLTFTLVNEVIVFNVIPTWNDSGNIIIAGSTAQGITDSLNKNYQLQKNFNISYLLNKITIQAKVSGIFSNLIFYSSTPSVALFHNTVGADKTLRTGYKTICDVYLESERDTNIFENIASSFYNVDANGRCIVKPGKIISKYFTEVDLPTFNLTTIQKVKKTVKRYYLKLAELYEGKVREVKTSTTLNAVDGIVNSDLFSDSFDYLTYCISSKCYLLDPAIEKIETWTTAQQFLYFVNYISSNINLITLCTKVYNTDGTSSGTIKGIISTINLFDTFIVPTGYDQLNLGAIDPTKEIYKYEVWLQDNHNVMIGKHITYYIVPKPQFGKEFWFKNKMGGFESVLCERQVHKLDIKRSELLNDSSYFTDIEEVNNNYECSTGNKTKIEIEHLSEFATSKKVFLLQNNDIYEVSVEAGTYTLTDENEDLYSYKFKYRIVGRYNPVVITGTTISGSFSKAFSSAFSKKKFL